MRYRFKLRQLFVAMQLSFENLAKFSEKSEKQQILGGRSMNGTEIGKAVPGTDVKAVVYGEIADIAAKEGLQADIVHDKLKQIQSGKLRELLEKQNALIERIEKLSELPNMREAERQRAVLESELKTVREEIVKRQEDVGVLAHELFALYDELGMKSVSAGEDRPEDIARRQTAKSAVSNAERILSETNIELGKVIEEKTEAEGAWWPFGKQAKIEAAASKINSLKRRIGEIEKQIKAAQENIAVVEEQIEVDKRERVRKASLAENFALIRDFTRNATTILKSDIEETAERAALTEKALNSALEKKRVTARELDALRDKMATTKRDLDRENNALSEIVDQGSSAYAEQQKVVTDLESAMTKMSGEELTLNTTHMAMTQAIEANKSSLAGLTVQHDTAQVYLIKLVNAEKTAEILGRNIDRMIKNTMQETANDALDRVTDSMTMTAVALGINAEVASGKARNEAIKRHDELMKELHAVRKTGDEAAAAQAARYLELDAQIRQGYAERGVDLEMSHLEAALGTFSGQKNAEAEKPAGEVTY